MSHDTPLTLTSRPTDNAISGRIKIPGDKSISHRSLMFGALASGTTEVFGLLECEDVFRTASALRALGATIEQLGQGHWKVTGRGLGALQEPENILDMGNSGTSARLLMGILGSHNISAVMTGDASLRKRPMGRVANPLAEMGARVHCRSGQRLPLMVQGSDECIPIRYKLPVASAQVKSCILLAGLNTAGETTVVEKEHTRDHSENLLQHFGAELRITDTSDGREITLVGQPELKATKVYVPSDPSSAAFPMVAALIKKGSELQLSAVCVNPRRRGIFTTLQEMGANITFENERIESGEPLADIVIRGSELKGIEVPADRAPSMIDEYPILAIAAAYAEGKTVMPGLHELRAKESDRLAAVAAGLRTQGIELEEGEDYLIVQGLGKGRKPLGGGRVETHFDHRIAMSFLIMGLGSENPVSVKDASAIKTSFPNFTALMNSIGMDIG